MLSITQQSLKNSIIFKSKKFDQIRRRKEKENGGAQLDMGVGLGEDERWRRRNKERKWRELESWGGRWIKNWNEIKIKIIKLN